MGYETNAYPRDLVHHQIARVHDLGEGLQDEQLPDRARVVALRREQAEGGAEVPELPDLALQSMAASEVG